VQYTKTIVAFVALLVTNLSANLMDSGQALPQDGGEWARLIISTLAGTALTFGLPNTTTDPVVAREQSVRLKANRAAA
jgi:hypothetical protein